MKWTAGINEVLSLLPESENFISVGKILNNRNAIKFIIDNLVSTGFTRSIFYQELANLSGL